MSMLLSIQHVVQRYILPGFPLLWQQAEINDEKGEYAFSPNGKNFHTWLSKLFIDLLGQMADNGDQNRIGA